MTPFLVGSLWRKDFVKAAEAEISMIAVLETYSFFMFLVGLENSKTVRFL
jgi:hypothetical protein